jgi:glutamate-ammonia-ligase adenylyltransferase
MTIESLLDQCPAEFLEPLEALLSASPPMLDALRSHPDWLSWLRARVEERSESVGFDRMDLDSLREYKRREFLDIAFRDIAGIATFEQTVERLSDLADLVIGTALRLCRQALVEEDPGQLKGPPSGEGFAVFALGKLGGRELNYSSDVDLVFCRRDSGAPEEQRFFTRLGERLVQALSRLGPEGFLYRVDMRLRPHGETGPLVPTLNSLVNYYESWGEAWERQALIKARFVAGAEDLGGRLQDFLTSFTFARQMDDSALEELKRTKHRSEKEYAERGRTHLKQGPGGIRDIEFYVQFQQLACGWARPEVRIGSTLQAIEALGRARVLLEGEESLLSLAYRFLRIVEHRLQLRALTPQAVLPQAEAELAQLARGLGFEDSERSAGERLLSAVRHWRSRVRETLERIYLSPGYLRLAEREEEFAHLLSDRTPKERVRELLSHYGFQDIEKAWQNIRLLAIGPAGRILPPGERRAFLECAFPVLEALRDSIDPDLALHHLESFTAATGNRVSFLRALAARRPHLVRLTNLLALSSLCHQILSRHPEYFDSLARGVFLHEGRSTGEMYQDLQDRLGASPRGEMREIVLRRFRQREMVRIAYRDMAGLADALEISRELSGLAEACVIGALDWTRPVPKDLGEPLPPALRAVGMGKLGSRQMHYSSDLDLMYLYDDPPPGASADVRARIQLAQDERVESMLEIMAAVTTEGVAYPVDLRLRPEGASGLLARSWASFIEYADQYMQPWERMALVRARLMDDSVEAQGKWRNLMAEVVYGFPWNEEAFESIRHLKRRIENEKSKESRIYVDFKYGKGGITDLEFLVQFLQIRYGGRHEGVRAPDVAEVVAALCAAGAISAGERDSILQAHRFQRGVENRYQLVEEWNAREVSRESPLLARVARSLGYRGETPADMRRSFLADWDAHAAVIRPLLDKYFYTS